VSLTPTRTILTITANSMDVNVMFLNTFERNDLVRKSFPFTYLYVDAVATDGKQPTSSRISHACSYESEWLSKSMDTRIEWSTTQTSSLIYHEVYQSSRTYSDRSTILSLRFSFIEAFVVTYRTGSVECNRNIWHVDGTLSNFTDAKFRDINENGWTAFDFAYDARSIHSTPLNALVWVPGLVWNPSIT
ncbi:hypothetical protein DFS33DRAFT_1246108, partial [Desarmillaria ectypa]